jgi:phosphoenolpyruvate phosphomutase
MGMVLNDHLAGGGLSVYLEAHSPLSARIVEEAGFDGIWASGFALSTLLAKRDANEVSWSVLADLAGDIASAVRIPVLFDGDNAYADPNIARELAMRLARRGVAGMAIEDKVFPKSNSFQNGADELMPSNRFARLIASARDHIRDRDFAIIARTEALVLGQSVAEALSRCNLYAQAGAHAVIVHSVRTDGADVLEVLDGWEQNCPIIAIPTAYHTIGLQALADRGVSIAIWANHLMRSSIAAMRSTARSIRENSGVLQLGDSICDMEEVFEMMNYAELSELRAGRKGDPDRSGAAEVK